MRMSQGRNGRVGVEALERSPGRDQAILGRIVGIMLVAENRESHPSGGLAVALDQEAIGLLVSCRRLAGQLAVTCVPITHQPPQTLSGAPVRARGPAAPVMTRSGGAEPQQPLVRPQRGDEHPDQFVERYAQLLRAEVDVLPADAPGKSPCP